MTQSKFGTSISCLDGRVQLPIIHWLKEKYNINYVDTITDYGIVKLFSDEIKEHEIKTNVLLSLNTHASKLIMVTGHHGCLGNNVSKEKQVAQIKNAVQIIESWNTSAKVIGVWINQDLELEILKIDSTPN